MTGQMRVEAQALPEHQAILGDAAELRLGAEIGPRAAALLQQPEHAARLVEGASDIEHRRRDLVVAVEGAEYNPSSGRPARRVSGQVGDGRFESLG